MLLLGKFRAVPGWVQPQSAHFVIEAAPICRVRVSPSANALPGHGSRLLASGGVSPGATLGLGSRSGLVFYQVTLRPSLPSHVKPSSILLIKIRSPNLCPYPYPAQILPWLL